MPVGWCVGQIGRTENHRFVLRPTFFFVGYFVFLLVLLVSRYLFSSHSIKVRRSQFEEMRLIHKKRYLEVSYKRDSDVDKKNGHK